MMPERHVEEVDSVGSGWSLNASRSSGVFQRLPS